MLCFVSPESENDQLFHYDFSLWCVIMIKRVNKSNVKTEKVLILVFKLFIALMIVSLFWTGQNFLTPVKNKFTVSFHAFLLFLFICLFERQLICSSMADITTCFSSEKDNGVTPIFITPILNTWLYSSSCTS